MNFDRKVVNMKRKRLWTYFFKDLDKALAYLKLVKEINGSQVQVELTEDLVFNCYVVDTWQVR